MDIHFANERTTSMSMTSTDADTGTCRTWLPRSRVFACAPSLLQAGIAFFPLGLAGTALAGLCLTQPSASEQKGKLLARKHVEAVPREPLGELL